MSAIRWQCWQYRVLESGLAYEEAELNRLGREGWELIAVEARRLYLRRPMARRHGKGEALLEMAENDHTDH